MSDLRGAPDLSSVSLSLSLSITLLLFSLQLFLSIFQAFLPQSPLLEISPLPATISNTSPTVLPWATLFGLPPSLFFPTVGVELSVDLFLFSFGRKGRDEATRPPSEASLGPDQIRAGLSVSFSAGWPLFKLPSSSSSSFSHCKWGHLFCSIQADAQRCSKPTSHYLAFPSLCFVSLRGCPLVSLSPSLFISLPLSLFINDFLCYHN